MTATKRSLFRRTILATALFTITLAFGVSLEAQDFPNFKLKECPADQESLQVGELTFYVQCGIVDPHARWRKNIKDAENKKFVLVIGLLDLGVFADKVRNGIPVTTQDLLEIQLRINKLCESVSCESFKEVDGLSEGMSTQDLTEFIVNVICDKHIVAGVRAEPVDVIYRSDIKTMRHAAMLLSRHLHTEIAAR